MTQIRIVPVMMVLAMFAAAAGYAVPRGLEAQALLAIEDDPARIADRALEGRFDTAVASRDIDAALAADDADLARSFVELARERDVAIDSGLAAKVDAAVADAASSRHAMTSFALGLATGEPKDVAGFAGSALGDLFVFGDIRDAAREGSQLLAGEPADELVLGLAGVGLALTAGTYASMGAGAPARVGVSLAKLARKTGHLAGGLTETVGGSLRRIVDWSRLKTALAGASVSDPAAAVRAAREAVKVERAGGLLQLARDVGRVQSRAGTEAALDGLRIAESPREMSRLARLAEAKGGKTRAILKVAGRGALALTVAAVDIGVWIIGALVAVFGVVSSLKAAAERMTLRAVRRAKARRLAAEQARFAALTTRG